MLVARSVAEAHFYLDLNGCPRDRRHRLELQGDKLVSVYEAEIDGAPVRWEFDIPTPEPAGGHFGDAGPSAIVGPGEWLLAADRLSKLSPADATGLDPVERQAARARLELAMECLGEVLKFVPSGQDAVPESAFRTEVDRAVRAREPGRFRAPRLQAVLDTWRALAASYGRAG